MTRTFVFPKEQWRHSGLSMQCTAADEVTLNYCILWTTQFVVSAYCLNFNFIGHFIVYIHMWTGSNTFTYIGWVHNVNWKEKPSIVKVWLLNWADFFVPSCMISFANIITVHNWFIFDTQLWTAVKGHKHIDRNSFLWSKINWHDSLNFIAYCINLLKYWVPCIVTLCVYCIIIVHYIIGWPVQTNVHLRKVR